MIVELTTWASAQGKGAGGGAAGGASSPGGGTSQSAPATTGNAPFESVMLAYGALNESTQALAARTCKVATKAATDDKAPLIVIVDQASLATLAAYDAFDRTSRFLTSAYQSMIPPASSFTFLSNNALVGDPTIVVGSAARISTNDTLKVEQEQMTVTAKAGTTLTVLRGQNSTTAVAHAQYVQVVDLTTINAPPAPIVTPAAAGAGGDVFSDITNAVAAVLVAGNSETGSTITIQDSSAALTLFSNLSKNSDCVGSKVEIVYPGVYGTGTDLTNFNASLDSVINARAQALAGLAAIQPQTAPQGAAPPMKLTAFNTFDTAFTQFFQSWFAASSTSGSPTSGLSALTPIVQGFSLRQRLLIGKNIAGTADERQLYLVYINVAAAGGTLQDRKNAISALTTGDWIHYSGGVVLNAMILRKSNPQGPIFSGVLRYRSPLTHIKKPLDPDATHYGDNLGDVLPQP
jgi:hypothetical protein